MTDNQLNTNHYFFPFLWIAAVATWSVIRPFELLTWSLESFPILALFFTAIATRHRFRWTPLSYWLFACGCTLVLIGGHYTYARMPLFEWFKEAFGWDRNYYDRFGHFFQGVVPAIIFRELLLRKTWLSRTTWLWFIVIALCTTKSVLYEFAEWWTTLILGENAHEFLAMQGDIWDAQQDMFWAMVGSFVSLLVFRRLHDKQLTPFREASPPACN